MNCAQYCITMTLNPSHSLKERKKRNCEDKNFVVQKYLNFTLACRSRSNALRFDFPIKFNKTVVKLSFPSKTISSIVSTDLSFPTILTTKILKYEKKRFRTSFAKDTTSMSQNVSSRVSKFRLKI